MSMKTIRWAGATAAWTMAAVAMGQNASFLNPSPYQSVADSPFFGSGQSCYALEDFQTGSVSTPGLTIPQNQGVITSPAGVVGDSGSPLFGLSSDASVGVLQLDFDQVVIGALPTKVGFVWTRGSNGTITVTVTNSLGQVANRVYEFLAPNQPGNGADDQFIGVEWASGIQTISILFNPVFGDIDHVQFDLPASSCPSVPGGTDFNGDGHNDYVVQNPVTGEVFIQLAMDGVFTERVSTGGFAGSAWYPAGLPDVNGDGKPDILWRNSMSGSVVYWTMDGTSRVDGGSIGQPVGAVWKLVGTPDLDGDGDFDMVWQSTSTGQLVAWFMQDGQRVSGQAFPTQSGPTWEAVGMCDLNADGNADIIWRNRQNFGLVVWYMQGIERMSGSAINQACSTVWSLISVADQDGDGDPDLVWRNVNNGTVAYWRMQGVMREAGSMIQTGFPASWRLIGS